MASKIEWPEWVPELEPGEIGTGKLRDDIGCPVCLLGWCEAVFKDEAACDKAADAIYRVIVRKLGHGMAITRFNDRFSSPLERATVWNKAMKKLGYNEVFNGPCSKRDFGWKAKGGPRKGSV